MSPLDNPEAVQLDQGANPNATIMPPDQAVWTKFVHERLPVTTRSGLDVREVHEILMLLAAASGDLSVPVSVEPRRMMSVGNYMLKHVARQASRR